MSAEPTPSIAATGAACLNCGTPLEGRFCSACGQRDIGARLTLRSILRDLRQHWLDLDAPLFATFLGLWRDPGGTARQYVEGRRVRFANPFKYSILAFAATYAVGTWFGTSTIPIVEPDPDLPRHAAAFIAQLQERMLLLEPYTAIVHFLTMPVLALFLRVLFLRAGRTWVDFYVFALFVSGQAFLVELVATPFGERGMWVAQLAPAALFAFGAGRFTGAKPIGAALRALAGLVAFMLAVGVLVAALAVVSILVWP